MTEPSKPVFRSTLAGLGGLGGLTLWALTDPLQDLSLAHPLILFLWALAGGFFVSAMTAMGPLPTRNALLAGVMTSVPAALLLALASLRFSSLSAATEDGHLIVATVMLIALGLPFVICALRDGNWRDYSALFDTSWRLVVHFTAAWIFAGLCWLVLLLSMVLLDLVGITFIEDMLREEIVVFIFNGVVLGLGLAVIFELSDYISPYLVLSLLRLLLIPLLVIVTIFLIALPFRGLTDLFDTLSPALVMMATSIGLISLISVAVERDDEDAVAGPVMQNATRYAALLLVILTSLSVYAVIVRLVAYGWTPPRFAAFFIALVTFAYGVAYALTVVGGPDWMSRLRRANVSLALGLIAALAICMTPLVNPQAISVNSQIARFESGRTPADALPFFEMRDDWGTAGERAFAQFSESDDPAVIAALAEQRVTDTELTALERRNLVLEVIRENAVVRPEGTAFPDAALSRMNDWHLNEVRQACAPDPERSGPGCAIIEGDFLTDTPGQEYALILIGPDNHLIVFWLSERQFILRQQARVGQIADNVIADLLNDGFSVAPAQVNSLEIGDRTFNPFN